MTRAKPSSGTRELTVSLNLRAGGGSASDGERVPPIAGCDRDSTQSEPHATNGGATKSSRRGRP
jgi:hypothetical protein